MCFDHYILKNMYSCHKTDVLFLLYEFVLQTLRCAALPDETRDATLVDSTGQTWMCKWLVNHSGRRLSAGWKRFAVDHLLEEGDVCVFEMIDRINLTLLIHIFRIELDDHALEPIEVRKSEDRRVSGDPTKRKRKSRAKPKGLGPPVPKLPAYSGCRMEKLGESSSPLRGANVLPNMPSYKYTALQSRRRPVTMEERRRAELGARNLNTKNPSVTVVMRNSSVYCHFLVVGQALNSRLCKTSLGAYRAYHLGFSHIIYVLCKQQV